MENLREYYENLLIRQYAKGRAKKTIFWAVDRKIRMVQLARQLSLAFDLETAGGIQLDTIGKYVNLGRIFENGAAYLSDDDFRFFIRWKIISNLSLDNMASFHEAVNSVFGGAIILENNRDMSISYWICEPLNSDIVSLLETNKDLLPAPLGIAVSYIVDSGSGKIFGMNDFYRNSTVLLPLTALIGFSNIDIADNVEGEEGDFLEVNEIFT
jgi:hypothetical protein